MCRGQVIWIPHVVWSSSFMGHVFFPLVNAYRKTDGKIHHLKWNTGQFQPSFNPLNPMKPPFSDHQTTIFHIAFCKPLPEASESPTSQGIDDDCLEQPLEQL